MVLKEGTPRFKFQTIRENKRTFSLSSSLPQLSFDIPNTHNKFIPVIPICPDDTILAIKHPSLRDPTQFNVDVFLLSYTDGAIVADRQNLEQPELSLVRLLVNRELIGTNHKLAHGQIPLRTLDEHSPIKPGDKSTTHFQQVRQEVTPGSNFFTVAILLEADRNSY